MRRKHVITAVLAAALVVFLAVLVTWVGKGPKLTPVAVPSTIPSLSTDLSTAPAIGPSVSISPSGTGTSGLPGLLDQNIPGFSLSADPGGLPLHSIKMVVTSDSVIAGFGYLVANGKPHRYVTYFVKSPVTVITSGRSDGYVAFMVAQASSTATYVTCTLTVDGVVKSQHTGHGPYSGAACIG